MNFTEISPTQFEELCYDLLHELGFSDLSWRKGTALNASPSDQGRDIEANYIKKEVDGFLNVEKWFVECKHYKEGVPPTALQGALAWAESTTPHTLLIVASGFLSNPAKEFIKEYKRNRNPPFRIKIWENPDLQRMLAGRAKILNKFHIAPPSPHIDILHPGHKKFIIHPPLNTLPYFIKILESLDSTKRDSWFFTSYLHIINPEMAEPSSGDQCMAELSKTPISYHEFKLALQKTTTSELFLINSIINEVLTSLLRQGDTTALQELLDRNRAAINFFKIKLKENPDQKKSLNGCINMAEHQLRSLEETLNRGYQSYCEFCETVLDDLYKEKMKDLPPLSPNFIN